MSLFDHIAKMLEPLRRLAEILSCLESGAQSANALFYMYSMQRLWPNALDEMLPHVELPRESLPDIASWYGKTPQSQNFQEQLNKNIVAMAQCLISLPLTAKIALFEEALRIPTPKSPEVFAHYIRFMHQYGTGDQELLDICARFASLGPDVWHRDFRIVWGIYIATLARYDRQDEAGELLRQHKKRYNLSGLERLPRAALFAWQNGLSNGGIKKAAQLMEAIAATAGNLERESPLSGKTVAIVGSSPLERGKRRGKEIDAHDVVIRFNMGEVAEEFREDYGARTTILSRNANPRTPFLYPRDAEWLLMPDGPERLVLSPVIIQRYLDAAKSGRVKFWAIPLADYRAIMSDAGFPHLSTGIAVCAYFKKLVPTLARHDLYGFSHLLDDRTLNYGEYEQFHYYNRRSDDVVNTVFHSHPLAKEREFLKRLFPE